MGKTVNNEPITGAKLKSFNRNFSKLELRKRKRNLKSFMQDGGVDVRSGASLPVRFIQMCCSV